MSCADALTILLDETFNESGVTQDLPLNHLPLLQGFCRVWQAGFINNSSLTKFQVSFSVLSFDFSVMDSFWWFHTGIFCKSILLLLVLFKVAFLDISVKAETVSVLFRDLHKIFYKIKEKLIWANHVA